MLAALAAAADNSADAAWCCATWERKRKAK